MKWRMARLADAAALRRAGGLRGTGGRALSTVTRLSDGAGLWLGVAGAMALTGGPRARVAAGKGTAALLLTSAVVNGPVKTLVRRPRPGRWATLGRSRAGKAPRTSSFPSGHTASAFAFVTAAAPDVPTLAPPLGLVAAAVGWSRVHSGQHFPTDVAAGAVLGTAGGLALRWAWGRLREAPSAAPEASDAPAPTATMETVESPGAPAAVAH